MDSDEIEQIETSPGGKEIKALISEQERCRNRDMWPRWIEIERRIMEICGQQDLFAGQNLPNLPESDPTQLSGVLEEPPTAN